MAICVESKSYGNGILSKFSSARKWSKKQDHQIRDKLAEKKGEFLKIHLEEWKRR